MIEFLLKAVVTTGILFVIAGIIAVFVNFPLLLVVIFIASVWFLIYTLIDQEW